MKRFLLIYSFLFTVISLAAQTPTVANLTTTSGSNVKWYNASSGGTAYAGTEALVDGQIYYASQTVNGIESATRLAVTANITAVPTAGTHKATRTSITWNWNASTNATGYKWNTTNNYNTATDLGNVTTFTQSGLSGNTSYTIYMWAYTASCNTGAVTFTQSTSSGDAIYNALSTSQASYSSASAYDLIKITASEYAAVQTALSATAIGYTGTIDNSWATTCAPAFTTFSYNSNLNPNTTVQSYPAGSYPVAFTFQPALNPAGEYSCQLKYNNAGTVGNVSNLYLGATAAVQDRQYFVIKTPSAVSTASYIALYTSSGLGTYSVYPESPSYWAQVDGNVTGAQAFSNYTGAYTKIPGIQVLVTSTKPY